MAKADAWGAPEGTAFERRKARGDGLAGNTRLIAEPAYRRLLAAEPLLRRSIPALIIIFLGNLFSSTARAGFSVLYFILFMVQTKAGCELLDLLGV